MKVSLCIVLLGLIGLAFSQPTAARYPRVIYGVDGRTDFYQVSTSLQNLGKSGVLIVDNNALVRNGDGTYSASNVGTATTFQYFCPNEPFANQTMIASEGYCSGFLLSTNPPWVGTASHCTDLLSNGVVVFGFELTSATTTRITFAANAVYSFKSVVFNGNGESDADDFLIAELDRPVTGYTAYTSYARVSIGDALTLIGHPAGLPKKFESTGKVLALPSEGYIIADTDSYGGNSGSPVFDFSGNLIGILVAGAQDFTYSDDCRVSNHCPEGTGCGDGEILVPICRVLSSSTVISDVLGTCSSASTATRTPASTRASTPSTTSSSTHSSTPSSTHTRTSTPVSTRTRAPAGNSRTSSTSNGSSGSPNSSNTSNFSSGATFVYPFTVFVCFAVLAVI